MLLTNLITVEGKSISIGIQGSEIKYINQTPFPHPQAIDCSGLMVSPGHISLHCHLRDGQESHKATWDSETWIATKSGVTMVANVCNGLPSITTANQLARLIGSLKDRFRSNQLPKDMAWQLWFCARDDNVDEVAAIVAEKSFQPDLAGIKIFMAPSTGNICVREEKNIRTVMELCAEHGVLVAVHAEDWQLLADNERLYPAATVKQHCLIRNTEVETRAVKTALRLHREAGGGLIHFFHLSAPESVELVRDAKEAGQTVTVEVCMHHLYFDEEAMRDKYRASIFKMNPPLRSRQQVDRLVSLLADKDMVDTIDIDHAAHTEQDKASKVYKECASGVPGLQTFLPAAYDMVVRGVISPCRYLELTSSQAAKMMGVNKGKIEIGYDADLVIFDPEKATILDEQILSNPHRTPFHKMDLHGQVKKVLIAGKIVFDADSQTTVAV